MKLPSIHERISVANQIPAAACLLWCLALSTPGVVAQATGSVPQQPTSTRHATEQGGGAATRQEAPQDAPPKKTGGVGGFFRRMNEAVERDAAARETNAGARSSGSGTTVSSATGSQRRSMSTRELPRSIGQCQTTEDRFKNLKSYQQPLGAIYQGADTELRLALSIDIYDGRDPNSTDSTLDPATAYALGREAELPPQVIMSLQFTGARPAFLEGADLIVIADGGAPVKLGRVTSFGSYGSRDVYENYQVRVPVDEFRVLAGARRVAAQIKHLELRLTDQVSAALRDFAACSGISLR